MHPKFTALRNAISGILKEETELMDIVRLIGADVLPEEQKLTLEIARVIRVGFLQQNAFHKEDTYVPLDKQFRMMQLILHIHETAKALLAQGISLNAMKDSGVFEQIIQVKYTIPNHQLSLFDTLTQSLDDTLNALHTDKQEGLL